MRTVLLSIANQISRSFSARSEVEAALAQLSSTHAQLGRASPNSEERSWALAELKATLAAVVPDLEELEESVAALEEVGVARRLGIADKEVRARRDFVERARGEIAVRVALLLRCRGQVDPRLSQFTCVLTPSDSSLQAIRRQLPESREDSPVRAHSVLFTFACAHSRTFTAGRETETLLCQLVRLSTFVPHERTRAVRHRWGDRPECGVRDAAPDGAQLSFVSLADLPAEHALPCSFSWNSKIGH